MPGAADFERAQKRIEEMKARAKNLRPALMVLAQDLRTFVDDRFATSTAPDGQPWAELSESALRSRARRAAGPSVRRNALVGPLPEGVRRTTRRAWTRSRARRAMAAVFDAKILIDTARLRQSITTKVGRSDLTVGTNVVYAGVHQFGSDDGATPPRPFLPFTSAGGRVVAIEGGPATALWTRIREAVRGYIATGRVT